MALNVRDMPIEVTQGDLVTRYVELGWHGDPPCHAACRDRHGTGAARAARRPLPEPHWGVVLAGTITITHADGTSETAQAGQLYHWPAGHTGVTEGGVTFIEVGPVEPMRELSEHARKLFS